MAVADSKLRGKEREGGGGRERDRGGEVGETEKREREGGRETNRE